MWFLSFTTYQPCSPAYFWLKYFRHCCSRFGFVLVSAFIPPASTSGIWTWWLMTVMAKAWTMFSSFPKCCSIFHRFSSSCPTPRSHKSTSSNFPPRPSQAHTVGPLLVLHLYPLQFRVQHMRRGVPRHENWVPTSGTKGTTEYHDQ